MGALQEPLWTAGLLQGIAGSLVGTLLALGGAGWVLVIQLRHDRELAAKQAQEAREAWRAERHASAANEVGLLLLDAVDEIRHLDEDDWVQRMRVTTPPNDSLYAIINVQEIPGMNQLIHAKGKADLSLNLDSAIKDLTSEISANWWASLRLTTLPLLAGLTPEQSTTVLHRISRSLLWPSSEALIELGRALCRWDGRGTPPGLAALPEWEPTAGGRVPPVDPERSRLIEAAGESAAELIHVLGYRSTSLS
ncbi:hypothetical protein J4N02_14880 [Propioniciclava sp. MC1595]|uniref:hypothetical protein n=1 Tax=Propioniciclava sp. MC1595 TaxID=2760308 RepID=UPI0016621FEF|nr:hypothetical protein [Propioniciclava sp. MC1595]MBB1496167.1 hypothetical protein [Propioniciclava sp. MC1595]QTE25754.1 hypothetical protein J4N02_14880 [Propioniciclava sp. MC1595]